MQRYKCITIVLEFSCRWAKAIQIHYVWTRIFLKSWEKDFRFQKYPNSCKAFLSDALSNGSEAFSLLICLDATKFVLLPVSVFTVIATTCPKIWTKPLPMNAKSSLPVDERRSQMSLLKLHIVDNSPCCLVNHEVRPWDHWRSQHW